MTLIKKRVETLISKMTLEEKLAQIGSYWMYELQTGGKLDPIKLQSELGQGIGQITRVAGATTQDPVSAAKSGNQIQEFLINHTRLGIPAIFHEEACAGAMILGGTAFPQVIGLASTFQPELAEQMTTVIRKQLLAIGARQSLSPVLDVLRDPRWGRTEETFGEDPTLVSNFGVAYIRGLQGDDLKNGVMATAKHFIGHSFSQGGLNCGPVHIGKRELYDIFLGPFQTAIRDAKLASVMNSYPELDGEVVAASRAILTDLLRNELGFDGVVVSDYEAILMIHNFHYMASTLSEAACKSLQAGIDVELPTIAGYGEPLKLALESGDLNIETIDLAVSRHLQKKIELNLFENPYVNEETVLEVFETDQQRMLAREIAFKSMVLLKNDGILPLNKQIGTLAVIGPNAAYGRSQLGDYSYEATRELMMFQAPVGSDFLNLDEKAIAAHEVKIITVLEGVKTIVSPDTKVLYAKGCDNLDSDESYFNEAVNVAKQADAVVLVLGDRSGLIPACTTGEFRDTSDLRLPGIQEELAHLIIKTGKPVVVVLINGRPYTIPELDKRASAILEAWIPGEEGGIAVAGVLFGDRNPGGKLPVSFPRHVGQLPIFYNHKPSGMKSNVYGDYVSEKVTPKYAFGHGLSYTTFEYSDITLSKNQVTAGDNLDISMKITNTGEVNGDEVIQLYIRDEYASSPRPVKELKGYIRLNLAPAESKTVVFNLPVNQLAFYDNDMDLVLEPGRIFIMIGSSSEDIRLKSEFEIVGMNKMPVRDRLFVCPVEVH